MRHLCTTCLQSTTRASITVQRKPCPITTPSTATTKEEVVVSAEDPLNHSQPDGAPVRIPTHALGGWADHPLHRKYCLCLKIHDSDDSGYRQRPSSRGGAGGGRFATIHDFGGAGPGGLGGLPRGRPPQRADDGDEEDDDEPQEGERWFAGGERRQAPALVTRPTCGLIVLLNLVASQLRIQIDLRAVAGDWEQCEIS